MKTKLFLVTSLFFGVTQLSFSQENELPDAGNVGIGTTSPTEKLDVRGGAKIDSTLRVGDSLTVTNSARVGEDLTVTGNAFFKSNASVVMDFDVAGQTRLGNTDILGGLNIPNLNTTNELNDFSFLLTDENGAVVKSGIHGVSTLGTILYSLSCSPANNGIVENPTWANGPNRIFNMCPEVSVGIGTNAPLYKLDVRGTGYFNTGIRVGNVTASTFTNTALIEGERVANQSSPLVRLSVKKTDGTNEVRFKVESDGLVYCTAVKIRLSPTIPIPDYVFKSNYKLMPLTELKTFVNTYNHLPNIPSEQEIRENGLSIEQMQMQLLEKVEELTLYVLEIHQKNEELDAKNDQLLKELETLKAKLNLIEQ